MLGQFGFGQSELDLRVADAVRQHCLNTTMRFMNSVVCISLLNENWPQAQGVGGIALQSYGLGTQLGQQLFVLDLPRNNLAPQG